MAEIKYRKFLQDKFPTNRFSFVAIFFDISVDRYFIEGPDIKIYEYFMNTKIDSCVKNMTREGCQTFISYLSILEISYFLFSVNTIKAYDKKLFEMNNYDIFLENPVLYVCYMFSKVYPELMEKKRDHDYYSKDFLLMDLSDEISARRISDHLKNSILAIFDGPKDSANEIKEFRSKMSKDIPSDRAEWSRKKPFKRNY